MHQHKISLKHSLTPHFKPQYRHLMPKINLADNIWEMPSPYQDDFYSKQKQTYCVPTIRYVFLKKKLFHLTAFKSTQHRNKQFQSSCCQTMDNIVCQGLPCTPKADSKSLKNVKSISSVIGTTQSNKPVQSPFTGIKSKRNTIFIRQPSYVMQMPFEIDAVLKGKTFDVTSTEGKQSIGIETNWHLI